ncbi:MAG: hypothetical protein ACE5D8_05105 [Fidelibacterota bacterium]
MIRKTGLLPLITTASSTFCSATGSQGFVALQDGMVERTVHYAQDFMNCRINNRILTPDCISGLVEDAGFSASLRDWEGS